MRTTKKDYLYVRWENKMIQSPINYTGGKAKLLNQILPKFPSKINRFIDLFCGGCNVGLNVNANEVYYNDYNKQVIDLFKELKKYNKDNILDRIYEIVNEYNLSLVSEYGYEYYNCNSSEGLGKYNRDKFNKLRFDYNKMDKNKYASLLLYVLIVYAFNNQIRFNSKGEYNLPVGKRDFNKKMQEKLISFVDKVNNQNCTFTCSDFKTYNIKGLGKNDFVYIDPPYLITCATYNEVGGWTKHDEDSLLDFLDELDRKNIKFALSNVLENKGKKNDILINWISSRDNLNVYHLNYNYSNCNYHTKNKNSACDEVLITNY